MINNYEIGLIYLVDSIYYILVSVFLLFSYLKYHEFIYKINKKIIEIPFIKHPYFNFLSIYKYIYKQLKFIKLLIIPIMILGFYSYKLDYEYECQNRTDNNISNTINYNTTNVNQLEKLPNKDIPTINIDTIINHESFILFTLLFILFILIHYYRRYIKKHEKDKTKKNLPIILFLLSISGTITATFSIIDFKIEKLFVMENSEFFMTKKVTINHYNDDKHNYAYKDKKLIFIYFDNNSIVIKKKINEPNLKLQIENLSKLKQILSNRKSIYTIKLTGYASKEIVKLSNNSISDNYQISLARANNMKEYIINIINDDDFIRKNITFNIFAFSNQQINTNHPNKDYHMHRKVKVEITEFEEIKNITSIK